MIQTLNIENVALIKKATLEFDKKLNVISGETGAGKSIMLDSLSFVFGGRADKTLIRSGENKMKVEAIFTNLKPSQIDFIKNNLGLECDGELFLSRELDLSGRNSCKINGELVPVNMVKKLCLTLVDIHGQSEHLAILNNDYQLNIIDLFSKTAAAVLTKLADKINKVKEIENSIKLLGGSESEKQNLIDLYNFQITEIENAKIGENEAENLSQEKREMQQFEHINQALKTAYECGAKNGFSTSASESLQQCQKALSQIAYLNPIYAELYNRLSSVLIEANDIFDTIYTQLNNNVFDEERFNFVDQRLDFIKSLFRKYGGDYSAMQKYYAEISAKLDTLTNSAEKYKNLMAQKETLIEEINALQDKLHSIRTKAAGELSAKIGQELKFLGMPNTKMSVEFLHTAEPYTYSGYDKVEFMFSANLGFEPKPLNKVVSGGEMSRVMLAYKIVVGEVDDISTIVFDEVDSGLSGNIASTVAQYLARLSNNKQIIAVSHLPQICAMADNNIKVEKFSNNSTTQTQAVTLSGNDLYKEIARLMGASTNEAGLKVSVELKNSSTEYKNTLK